MITLKSPREVEIMGRAGRIVAGTLARMREILRPGMSTEDLDAEAERFIRSHNGAVPSFKGLYGFPKTLCTSIDQEIVHGIPSPKRVLAEGSIVSVDVGVHLEGLHADSATTLPVGRIDPEAERLLRVTQESLAAGIAAARLGNHVGDIGHAVQRVAEGAGYGVVRELVGHGIGTRFHEEPQVPNYGAPKRGPRLLEGMTLAIEPMITIGGPATKTLADKWTVVTADGSLSAHFEHTVVITAEGPREPVGSLRAHRRHHRRGATHFDGLIHPTRSSSSSCTRTSADSTCSSVVHAVSINTRASSGHPTALRLLRMLQ